jgi:hypothetical protein
MKNVTPPTVAGYGSFDIEPFEAYYARWPKSLANFPSCVVENWVYRHWQDFEHLWANRAIEQFSFTRTNLTNAEIMSIGHIDDWLKTLDYWGDELFRNDMRRGTWLAQYMLDQGSAPAPIIVCPDSAGLEHPRGALMNPNQLIEGHMRLAYLRGMIRHDHPSLRSEHAVWHVSLPRHAFMPKSHR